MFVVSRQITSHVEAKPDIIVAIFCFFDVSLLGGTLNKHFSRAAPEGKTKGAPNQEFQVFRSLAYVVLATSEN